MAHKMDTEKRKNQIMKIAGIEPRALRTIMFDATFKYNNNLEFKRFETKGKWIHFTLRVKNSRGPGHKISHSGRHIVAACWHAHRDFMKEVFNQFPNAQLISCFANYNGKTSFENQFEKTGQINIGSPYRPLRMDEACACST